MRANKKKIMHTYLPPINEDDGLKLKAEPLGLEPKSKSNNKKCIE